MEIGEKIELLLKKMGISQAELARRVGLDQSTINGLIRGSARTSRHLHRIAKALGTTAEYLTGETDDPAIGFVPDALQRSQLVPANDDGTVEIAKVDLALGMGATFLDDEFVPVEKVRISESLLRVYTDAPPEMLAIVDGIGDSMNPTIQDGDKVLIDMSQRVPMMHDRIWAMAFAGMGMIKRLRARPDGTMLLLSDNPSVPDDRATDGELHIIGRVAGVLRKL